MKQLRKISKSLSFTARNLEMAEEYATKNGYGSLSESYSAAMAFAHDKTFPDYIYNKPLTEKEKERKRMEEKHDLPVEEYVTQVIKGKIFAGKAWVRTPRGVDVSFPIQDAKLFDENEEPFITVHKAIIDGTYVTLNGETGSIMQEKILAHWDNPVPVVAKTPNREPIFADENGEIPKEEQKPVEDELDPEMEAMLKEERGE